MRKHPGRWTQTTVAAALVVAATVVGTSTPARAQVPWVTVTPSTDLAPEQDVTVEISGFPDGSSGLRSVSQCPTSDGNTAPGPGCIWVELSMGPLNTTLTAEVAATYKSSSGDWVSCRREACSLLVLASVGPDGPRVSATLPIEFAPGPEKPSLNHDAAPGLSPAGATVHLTGWGLPAGPATAGQCTNQFVRADEFLTRCGMLTPATVAPDGTIDATVTVREPLIRGDGSLASCATSCAVAVLAGDGLVVASPRGLDFARPIVELEPADGLSVGDDVAVRVTGLTGLAGGVSRIAACSGGFVETCDRIQQVAVDAAGTAETTVRLPRFAGSRLCVPARCTISVFLTTEAREVSAASKVVVLGESADHGVTPATDLIEGQPMAVRAEMIGGASYRLVRCALDSTPTVGDCEDPTSAPSVTAGPDGSVTASVPATQRLTVRSAPLQRYCRAQCSVALVPAATAPTARLDPATTWLDGYAMSAGHVTVEPSTALADGQTVVVTATGLPSTYAGPTRLFSTGGWAISVCDSAVSDAAAGGATLLRLFTYCGLPTGGGAVDVPGSTVQREVVVDAIVEHTLGGTTDCRMSPRGCVLGLTRFELDGSTSVILQPIDFG